MRETPAVQHWGGTASRETGEAPPGGLVVKGKGKNREIQGAQKQTIS